MGIVRIINTTAKSLGLPSGGGHAACDLPPGGHNIALEHIAAVRAVPGVAAWIEAGALKLDGAADATEKPAGVKPPTSLEKYAVEAARALIDVQDSEAALKLWAKNDSRKAVKRAVRERLATLGG